MFWEERRPDIIVGYLCKPFYDVITYSIFNCLLNLKTWDKKDDNYNNLSISRSLQNILGEIALFIIQVIDDIDNY